MVDHTDLSLGAVPRTTATTNWMINVSNIKTVKISNVSPAASARDIEEFFSFSGDVRYVEMRRETENAQVAYVTFKESQGADTAMQLTGVKIIDFPVNITPAEDYELPPKALQSNMLTYAFLVIVRFGFMKEEAISSTKKAEDMMSTMLAKGFILGKDAMNKAKAFEEQHHLILNASAAVTSMDQKMGLSEKLREVDELYQVSEMTKSALAVAEHKASSAGTTVMSNHYVSAGASWLSNAFYAVARAAEDVGTLTKEKVEKAEEERNNIIYKERIRIINDFAQLHLDETSPDEPQSPIVFVDSTNS
ncbi:hypothetical protein V6N13_029607 [Hibiscus sabdariffa]|uniref:Uncharacterized protein n=2 Tax=Hibiscus sabdariffa TaxID=183260 RepID=A0ABR2TA57_9ROSI